MIDLFKLKYLIVLCFAILLSACAGHQAAIKLTDTATYISVKKALYAQYAEWKSVPYRYGGMTKRGVDCSGLVYLTFLKKFGIKLARTTKQQVHSGKVVDKQADLKAGDLVFFKTGLWQRHVGIYLEKRKFLHVSTKKGVIISYMDNPYWRKKYWQAVRVLEP